MKRYISILIAAMLMVGSLSACGNAGMPATASDKINIVTTIFPEYDWVMNILGDNPAGAEVTLLLDNGVDLPPIHPTLLQHKRTDHMKILSVCHPLSADNCEDQLRYQAAM